MKRIKIFISLLLATCFCCSCITFLTACGKAHTHIYNGKSKTCAECTVALSTARKIIISSDVTEIPEKAFYEYKNLESVEISNGVKSIGMLAFGRCENLTSIKIADSIEVIDLWAFEGCDKLTNVTLPQGLEVISAQAFLGCCSLKTIKIPQSVTHIGECPFAGCEQLTSITVEQNNTAYKSVGGNLYTKDGSTLIQYSIGKEEETFIVPDGVITIGAMAFWGSDLTDITLPNGLITIVQEAFHECSRLTEIVIPDGVEMICSAAFYGCNNLESAYIPKSVEVMGTNVFMNLEFLTIYCEVESEPELWQEAQWKSPEIPVVWGYKGE